TIARVGKIRPQAGKRSRRADWKEIYSLYQPATDLSSEGVEEPRHLCPQAFPQIGPQIVRQLPALRAPATPPIPAAVAAAHADPARPGTPDRPKPPGSHQAT